VSADDVGLLDGLGCYTTSRIDDGRARWSERHCKRLGRDAQTLGLGELDPALAARAFAELGRAAFGAGQGIVRLQAGRADGRLQLIGLPRWVGEEPQSWTAATAPMPHPGRSAFRSVKLSGNPAIAWARRFARESAVNEALMYDADGYLIEGTRSNLFLVSAAGELCVPDLGRGGVRGLARDVILESGALTRIRNVSASEVRAGRELIAVNAIRGARPIIELDGEPVGEGRPGPWAAELDDILARS
jgi:D-alanine transaminase